MASFVELFTGATDLEMRKILDAFPFAISLCAIPGGKILYGNHVFHSMFRYSVGHFQTVNQFIDETCISEQQREQYRFLWQDFAPSVNGDSVIAVPDLEIDLLCADGRICTTMHAGVLVPDRGIGIAIYKDVSEFKRESRLLRRYAYQDPLTNLPNRRALQERWQRERQKDGSTRLALLVLDLDGFKLINDSYGHDAGDYALKEIAKRLKHVFRESDLVCRIGGDEFAVLMQVPADPDILTDICDRALEAVTQPVDLAGITVCLGASIGGAIYPDQATNTRQLFQRADHAMYQVKKSGKAGWRWWVPDAQPTVPPPVSQPG